MAILFGIMFLLIGLFLLCSVVFFPFNDNFMALCGALLLPGVLILIGVESIRKEVKKKKQD